jgi:hypothetical protein
MSGIEYGSLAFGFVVLFAVLAVIVSLLRFDARAWIGKGLKRGDLYSLVDVASGLRPDGLSRDQARRLQARGMVRVYGDGYYRATLKGRLALRIRQSARQTLQLER